MDDTEKTVVSGSAPSLPPNQDDGANSSETEKTVVAGGLPSMPPMQGSEPFYKIWIRAVTKPNEQTYIDIANSPDAKPNKAYIWVFATALASYFFLMLVMSIISAVAGTGGDLATTLITLSCAVPIIAGLVTVFFAIDVAILQWVAKMFKGTGSYNQLIYVLAAISAPLTLISGALGAFSVVPFLGYCLSAINIVLIVYVIVLNIMAVKAVNNFGWGEAIGTVLLPALVFGCICGCATIFILMLLGPVVGDVFSTINSSLGY